MKLASIVPMKNVAQTFDGDFAMLLTHLVDSYPCEHPKNCYTIMDNSLIELGAAASIEKTVEAAERCNADEIILPDVFRDGEQTLRSVIDSLYWLISKNKLGKFRIMAVCQGKDEAEFRATFNKLAKMPYIHCIGIPKVAETLHPLGRPGFEDLWLHNCTKVIHLLGCWTSLQELRTYKRPSLIRSCDTCIPALLSVNGITDPWASRPLKTIDLQNDVIDQAIYVNILTQLSAEGLL